MAKVALSSDSKDSGIFSFLQKNVGKMHLSRLKILSLLVVAVVQTGNVSLCALATAISGKAKKASKVRRLQRFVSESVLFWGSLVVHLLKLIGMEKDFVLILDRTNWKFGGKDINILMLSVAYGGVALPLLWLLLKKKGNSKTAERITLLQTFLNCFGADKVKHLLADREFIGEEWLAWLTKHQIRYYIRIRENALVDGQKGKYVAHLFRGIRLYHGHFPTKTYRIYGQTVYVSCFRGIEEKVIIISQVFDIQSFTHYKQRWEIETMFKAFKTQGFNIEDTHITDTEKLDRLLAVVAIAFYWAYKAGVVKDATIEPIKIIAKTNKPLYSFFKYGFDHLQEALQQADFQKIKDINQLLSYT
jgi:hypothetical protein